MRRCCATDLLSRSTQMRSRGWPRKPGCGGGRRGRTSVGSAGFGDSRVKRDDPASGGKLWRRTSSDDGGSHCGRSARYDVEAFATLGSPVTERASLDAWEPESPSTQETVVPATFADLWDDFINARGRKECCVSTYGYLRVSTEAGRERPRTGGPAESDRGCMCRAWLAG